MQFPATGSPGNGAAWSRPRQSMIFAIRCQQLRFTGRCRAIAARPVVAARPWCCTPPRVLFLFAPAARHPCSVSRWCGRFHCWCCSRSEGCSWPPRSQSSSPQNPLQDPGRKNWLKAGCSLQCIRDGASMTLGRFLICFVIGLVLALTIPQLTWLLWPLAASALLVVVQLIRS